MTFDSNLIIALLAGIPIGGLAVVLFAQGIKKLFGMNSDAAIHTMVIVVSAIAAGADYILSLKQLPPVVLGISSTSIYGFSQIAFKYSKYAGDFLNKVQATSAAKKLIVASDATVAAVLTPAELAGSSEFDA